MSQIVERRLWWRGLLSWHLLAAGQPQHWHPLLIYFDFLKNKLEWNFLETSKVQIDTTSTKLFKNSLRMKLIGLDFIFEWLWRNFNDFYSIVMVNCLTNIFVIIWLYEWNEPKT